MYNKSSCNNAKSKEAVEEAGKDGKFENLQMFRGIGSDFSKRVKIVRTNINTREKTGAGHR